MKKFTVISGSVFASFILLFLVFTNFVDHTAYFDSDYYKSTNLRIDSLKKSSLTVKGSFQAGFARVSITPGLQHNEDNYLEGKFSEVPLAGYGARKGKPAAGIQREQLFFSAILTHSSLFSKAPIYRQ